MVEKNPVTRTSEPLVYKKNRPTPFIRLVVLGVVALIGVSFLFLFRDLVDEGFARPVSDGE